MNIPKRRMVLTIMMDLDNIELLDTAVKLGSRG
jgi:hypothetical protein